MENRRMVLSAVGPDKPGIVAQVSKLILDSGANLEDSRMSVLAGDFALLVLFSGPKDAIATVTDRAEAIGASLGLQIRFHEATPKPPRKGEHRVYEVDMAGVDQPGIVHRVSAIVAALDANVLALDSRFVEAAFQGTPVFHLHALVDLPAGRDVSALASQLERIAEDLNMNLHISPVEDI